MLRTIEDILGLDHLGLNDANAEPMDDVFTEHPDFEPFQHFIPGNLLLPPVDPNLVRERDHVQVPRTQAVAVGSRRSMVGPRDPPTRLYQGGCGGRADLQ
jgi:hypothetical protein